MRDTHAEVIARRYLLRVLYSEFGARLRGGGDVSVGDRGWILEEVFTGTKHPDAGSPPQRRFELKPGTY